MKSLDYIANKVSYIKLVVLFGVDELVGGQNHAPVAIATMLAESLDDFTYLSPSFISLDEYKAVAFGNDFLLCFLEPIRFFGQEDVNFTKSNGFVVLAPHLELHFGLIDQPGQ
jgi:hypothetical protein